MAEFTITEDFPKNEIEFDARFSNPKNCYDYLFKQKWPNGFICKKCSHNKYWMSSRNLYICTQCEHQHSLTAGTIKRRLGLFRTIYRDPGLPSKFHLEV